MFWYGWQLLNSRTLGIFLSLTLLASCAPANSRILAEKVLWPPLPAQPLLEFKALYYPSANLLSPAFSALPRKFDGAEEVALSKAAGVVADGNGKVFVSDAFERNVLVFDFAAGAVRMLVDQDLFERPAGMDVDPEGRLYVVDAGKRKVLVFDRNGKHIMNIGNGKIFLRPMHVAVNAELGRVYVSDARKHQIAVFDMQGELLFVFGGPGRGNGKLAMPHGLRFDRQNRLHVADMLNARIEVFDPDGGFIASIGDRPPYQLELEFPRDIAFSSDGNLHIIDIKRALLVSCDPQGKLLLVTGGGGNTSHPLGLSSPSGIHVDAADTIYIADQVNNRLTMWQYLPKLSGTGAAGSKKM